MNTGFVPRHPEHRPSRSLDRWIRSVTARFRSGEAPEIYLSLEHEESIAEGIIVHMLRACYSCNDGSAENCAACPVFRKTYGGYLEYDGERRRRRCRANAEERLNRDLSGLADMGLEVSVDPAGKRFP